MRLGAVAVLAITSFSSTTWADDVADCLASHEEGQVAKRDGRFDRAREAFANCQRDVCPAAVRSRCTEFARALEAAQPTVVVIVRDAKGADVGGARVSVDGAPAVDVPGMGMRLNPGSRRLRVEAPSYAAVEKTILVHEGIKDA
ncbi:MAG TPA: PEGA domain-containing protein, partial [Polyangiaceae bacterium]|nr:PEGA domain-containing protein [Polyangiaceae bacterium]